MIGSEEPGGTNPDEPISGAANANAAESQPAFLPTRWSLILRASRASQLGGDATAVEAAMEWLCRHYWKPVHMVIRQRGHSPEDALDLTQGFFAELIAKEGFERVSPEVGRFRNWLLGALKHFLVNEHRYHDRQKRGRGRQPLSLEAIQEAETSGWEPVDPMLTPDKAFDRQWALAVLDSAMQSLQASYQRRNADAQFQQLKPYLAGTASPGEYDKLAAVLKSTRQQVAVAVNRLRERFRSHVQSVISETVAEPGEIAEEMQLLFAALRG